MSREITCNSCGADLTVPDGQTSVKCGFCGNTSQYEENTTVASSGNKKHKLMLSAVESENWEDVTRYATDLLEENPEDFTAWFYKGAAAGWKSRHIDDPSKEIMTCFRNAFANCKDEQVGEVLELIGVKGGELLLALALGSRGFAQEHGYLDVGDMLQNSWQQDVMEGHINKVVGYIDIAYMLTEINRNDRVEAMSPVIDANFINLYRFLYTKVDFSGKFSKKNPFNITDVTFTFVFDHDSDFGIKWGTRASEIESLAQTGGYDTQALEAAGLSEADFTKPKVQIEEAGGGCFVATVCLEPEDDDLLQSLRIFRDETLSKSHLGRKLIQSYYRYGPSVAYWISGRNVLRVTIKHGLIYPLEFITRKMSGR